MIERIESTSHLLITNSTSRNSSQPQLVHDTLLSAKGGMVHISLFGKLSAGVTSFIRKICSYFRRIFCFFRTPPSTLDIYQQNVHFISRLSTEFSFKRKQLSRPALKKWWFEQFYNLAPEMQKLLLLEDIILRAPSGQNKRKWAENHYRQYSMLSTQFVVHLNEETVGGKRYDPNFDVPKLLQSLHTYLTIEIDRLERLQEQVSSV